MATLTSKKVSDTYKDLLQVSNSNSGITGSLTNVEDGEGTPSVLQLSSAAVNITGTSTLQLAGTPITSTAAELNVLDGYTGSVTELNYLDTLHATGVTATEFDYLDGVSSNIQTQLDSKIDATLTTEQVQDIVGGMLGGTETRIDVTYDDTNGRINFVVDDMTTDTNTFRTITAGGNTLGATETLAFTAGSNVTISESGGAVTIASTDTNTQLSNAEVRTAVEAATDSNVFTDADHSKLDGIASGATANTGTVDTSGTPVDNDFAKFTDANTIEGRSASEMRSDLNIEDGADVTDATNVTAAGALMDSELSSIADVKALDQSVVSGASPTFGTANMSDASNKRFMTDAQETKLDSVEASADVTDTANVTSAGALMDSEVDADLKTFALPANTTISAFGKTIVDDADAAAVRSTIGVDAAGTDNSTDVSLGGSLDYITISGQTITRNAIDLAADVTGTLPVANGGTGATSLNDLITLGTHTTGNYVAGIAGTSNEITVSGSGSESASVTISLPDDVTIGRDLVVTRNLTVSGTTTTINTDEINIADNQIVLNSDFTGSTPTESAGIEVERGTQTNKSLQWNETDDKWTVGSETFVAGTFEGNLTGTVNTATQGTIDHDSLANFVANEHVDHSSVSILAGNGLSGGGTIAANRTLTVGSDTLSVSSTKVDIDFDSLSALPAAATGDHFIAFDASSSNAVGLLQVSDLPFSNNSGTVTNVVAGTGLTGGGSTTATLNVIGGTGITANANDIATNDSEIVHDNLSGFVANEHIDHSSVSVIAGTGLTGGGTIAADRTLNVIGGVGITANANDIALDIDGLTAISSVAPSSDFIAVHDNGVGVRKLAIDDLPFSNNTGDITSVNVTAGTGLSGGGSTSSGAFSATLNVSGLTVSELAASSLILSTESFADNDTTLMTSAAINDRIESFGYTTNTGDITGVTAGNGLSGGGSSGGVTVNLDINGQTLLNEAPANDDEFIIYDTSASAFKKVNASDVVGSAGDITAVVAGTNLSGGGTSGSVTLNVDDVFLKNNASDTTSGTITAAGFTTAGNLTLGGHAVNDIDITSEATDADDHLMTALAIKNRILDFGYTSNTGDITAVVAGTGLSGGATSGSATLNLDINGLSLAGEANVADTVGIYDASATAIKKITLQDIIDLGTAGDITGVTAGTGLTGGGASGAVTLNVVGGTGITANANDIALTAAGAGAGTYGSTADGTKIDTITIDAYGRVTAVATGNTGTGSGSGDITAVVAGTGISGGATSGSATVNLDINGLGVAAEANTADSIAIYDASATAIKKTTIADLPFTNNSGDITGVTAGNALTGGGSSGAITINHQDTSSQASVNGSGRTYIQDVTLDTYGHVTGLATATETVVNTDTNTNQLTTFVVEDGDSTEVTISQGKEWKFVEGGGIDINWTDTSPGSDGDPYDLTFTLGNHSGNLITSGTIASARLDADTAHLSGTQTFSGAKTFSNLASFAMDGNTISGIDDSGEFTNNDSHIMTSAAVEDKILGYGYTTNTGDITGVTAGTNLSGGGTSGTVTLNMATGGVGSGTYGSTANGTKIDTITVDAYGRVTAVATGATGSTSTSGTVTSVATGTGISGGTITSSGTVSIDAAQTGISSIKNTSLVVGRDNDNAFHFSTDNMIKVEVQTVQDEFRFAAGGTFHADADIIAYSTTTASDKRLKENIEALPYGLDDVMKMRAVEFDWKKDKANGKERGHDIGFIAQEMEEIVPEVVKEYDGLQGKDDFKAVDYSKLVPVLINAIQELKAEIEELKK